MKTLGKDITLTFFKDQDSYRKARKIWATAVQEKKELSPQLHLFYLVIMGKDWRKSFAYGTSVDVVNGQEYNAGAFKSNRDLRYNLPANNAKYRNELIDFFGKDLFTENVRAAVLQVLPELSGIRKAIVDKTELPEYTIEKVTTNAHKNIIQLAIDYIFKEQ